MVNGRVVGRVLFNQQVSMGSADADMSTPCRLSTSLTSSSLLILSSTPEPDPTPPPHMPSAQWWSVSLVVRGVLGE